MSSMSATSCGHDCWCHLPVAFNSLASKMMYKVTEVRNLSNRTATIAAQIGYALITLVAVVELVVSSTLSLLTVAYPCSREPFKRAFSRFQSSAFCIPWSLTYFICNPLKNRLVADEGSALLMCKHLDFQGIPHGACF